MDNVYYSGKRLLLLNIAICLGTFIQVLDSSIANVAIPYISGNLNVTASQGSWVITSFATSNAIVLPLTGWLSNYFGQIRLFVFSIIFFILASFFCGFSTSLPMLIFFRVLQGAVAGSLIPLSQSLILMSNPPQKTGVALGLWAMIIMVAPVLGPIIGGYLTETFSWPWIFYINVPIGMVSAYIIWNLLKNKESPITRNPIDWTGIALLSLGVGSLQILLDKGKELDWFESWTIITLCIVSVISLTYFCIWNFFQKNPIVNFNFFKNRNFLVGLTCVTLGYTIVFASGITIPLWLQTQQGYTPYFAGLAVAPVGIIPFLLSPLVGWLLSRLDLRILTFSSFVIFSIALFWQSTLTVQVDLSTIMLMRLVQGFGLAIFFLPLSQISFEGIPTSQLASATGLFNFIRILVGMGFGTSLSLELWSHREIFHRARLAEFMQITKSNVSELYETLGSFSSSFTSDVITGLLEARIEQQAYILSTNDLSICGAWLFLCLAPLIFLCKKKTKGEISSIPSH